MENLFQFKKIWKLTPFIQVVTIIFLLTTMISFGYLEYKNTGLVQGYPLDLSIFFVPIYEEIIFRGLILGALIKHFSSTKAIIYSSLLFGIWHFKNIFYLDLPELTYQIAYTTLFFGPIAAYITLRAKTIWLSVILHYINNLLAPLTPILAGYLFTLS